LALWNLDLALADVVSTSSVPELGAIRLAWWRERLEDLDKGIPPPAEPRLLAVTNILLPMGVSARELSKLEDCWLPLLEPFPWSNAVCTSLRMRGAILFGIGARLLGHDSSDAELTGAVWSLVDGARHCSDPTSRSRLIACAKEAISEWPRRRIRGELRPLTMVAAFAAHDALHNGLGGWRRLRTALAHSMLGIMPR